MSLLSFSKYYSGKTVSKEIYRKSFDTYIHLGNDILTELSILTAKYSNALFRRNNIYIDQKLDMWCPDMNFTPYCRLSNLFIHLRRIRERSKRPEITGINDKQKKVQRYE